MAAILADTQTLTVEFLERKLGLFTSLLCGRLEERFGITFATKNNDEKEDEVVSIPQKLFDTETLIQEEEKIAHFETPEEKGLDVSQSQSGISTGLKESNQETLRKIFFVPEMNQAIGKLPQGGGTFILTGKIRNGTLQFLYNNGLSILIKEVYVLRGFILRSRQTFKIRKFQLKIQEDDKRKKKGLGTRVRKWSKKARRKWRWKNNKLLGAGGQGESVEKADGRFLIYYSG